MMIGAFTDHLWQSTVFVLGAALVAAALRKNGAHVRHWIWLVASMKFLVPLSVLMSLGAALPRNSAAAPTTAAATVPELSIAVDQIAQPFTNGTFVFTAATSAAAANWIPWVVAGLWLGGFAVVVGMRLRGWQRVRSALRTSVAVPISAPVPVRSSPGLLEPGVVGVMKPVLLVPDGIERQLTPRQFEAVLLHEWCHVQRRDNLTSALHMIVEALFWFHPLVWFVGAKLVDERERACDEFVLRTSGDPEAYAESILNVCRLYVESPIACVSGVTGADLKKRISAIMVNRIGLQLNRTRKIALVLIALLAMVLPIAAGVMTAPLRASTVAAPQAAAADTSADQPPAQTAVTFDVASIKPCGQDSPPGPGRIGPGATSPGYLHLYCFTLRQLLNIASGNSDNALNALFRNRAEGGFDAVRGGPEWVGTERFTVEARAAGVTGRKALTGPPLLALLVDRFQLTFRRATEPRDVYALTVAGSGLKLKPVAPGSCFELDRDNMPAPGSLGGRQLCGMLTSSVPFRVTGAKIGKPPLAMGLALSDMLSSLMDRVVVDRTGLDGFYDLAFDYTPNETTPGALERLQRGREGGAPPPQVTGPPIFKALENLGLILTPAKAPVEFLVIDRVERLRPDSPAETSLVAAGPNGSRGPR
jgi:bla regulator protein BlaR1